MFTGFLKHTQKKFLPKTPEPVVTILLEEFFLKKELKDLLACLRKLNADLFEDKSTDTVQRLLESSKF